MKNWENAFFGRFFFVSKKPKMMNGKDLKIGTNLKRALIKNMK